MSTVSETKTTIVNTKVQCISLKSDRSQCIRNAGENTQFCWQHAKSPSKFGTVLAPAPEKSKSNRGRPKGSTNKKNVEIITDQVVGNVSVAPIKIDPTKLENPVKLSIIDSNTTKLDTGIKLSIIDNNIGSVKLDTPIKITIPQKLEFSSLNLIPEIQSLPKPPNSYLNLDLLKNLDWNISGDSINNSTKAGVGPFEITINVGGEDHINIPKVLKFDAKEYSVADVHSEIIKFFKTAVTKDDLEKLNEICNEANNDELGQMYTDMEELLDEESGTYEDIQIGINKLKSIVCRDDKYVAVLCGEL
jgi:hypothetical protein